MLDKYIIIVDCDDNVTEFFSDNVSVLNIFEVCLALYVNEDRKYKLEYANDDTIHSYIGRRDCLVFEQTEFIFNFLCEFFDPEQRGCYPDVFM